MAVDQLPVWLAALPQQRALGKVERFARLLDKGFRVSICEQLADPSTVKGIVPRGVVRVATPGLTLEPASLDARADNLLVAIHAGTPRGLAALEMSRSSPNGRRQCAREARPPRSPCGVHT